MQVALLKSVFDYVDVDEKGGITQAPTRTRTRSLSLSLSLSLTLMQRRPAHGDAARGAQRAQSRLHLPALQR